MRLGRDLDEVFVDEWHAKYCRQGAEELVTWSQTVQDWVQLIYRDADGV